MPTEREMELMSRAAVLYYLEDVTQAEVATHLGLSRVKVGRLLKRARAEGIVEIRVHAPPAITERLEQEVARRFGLRHALLAADHGDADVQRDLVAQRVADLLIHILRDHMTVAVGMGRNVSAVAGAIRDAPARRCAFVPAIGGSPAVARSVDPADICRRLAERFSGDALALFAPAYAETPQVREAFLLHEDVRSALERAASADIAVVGVGDAEDGSAVVRMGCFSQHDMQRMRRSGAVGDILGFFFGLDGNPVAEGMADRVISVGAEAMSRIGCTVAVVSEAGKARAILGALRTGVVDVLATSVANAREVLNLAGACDEHNSSSGGESA
ncbi:MAG TPA: sugar-binding transcriptional regulator [Chthonomonadales bacterium]|nr:sugar-binding transcriptional regulator [Chthonomonadales bacterium]